MSLPQAVCDALDVSAVIQLILKERESRDLGCWDYMRDCFHPDAQVRVSWFRGSAADFIRGSVDMASRMVNRHRLAPIHVVLSGNRAVAHDGNDFVATSRRAVAGAFVQGEQ